MKYLKPFDFKSHRDPYTLKSKLLHHNGVGASDLIYADDGVSQKLFMGGVWIALITLMGFCLHQLLAGVMLGSSMSVLSACYIFIVLVTGMAMNLALCVTFLPSWFSKLYRKVVHRRTDFADLEHAIVQEQWDSPVLQEVFDEPTRFAIASNEDLARRHEYYAQLPENHACRSVWGRWLKRSHPIRQEDLMALDHLEQISAPAVKATTDAPKEKSSEQHQKDFRASLVAPPVSQEPELIQIQSSEDALAISSKPVLALTQKAAQ